MRRLSCARTRLSSTSCASAIACSTAFFVISWKTMRLTGTFGFSTSRRCQLIDSPSRSGSVASITADAPFSAALSSATFFRLSSGTT